MRLAGYPPQNSRVNAAGDKAGKSRPIGLGESLILKTRSVR